MWHSGEKLAAGWRGGLGRGWPRGWAKPDLLQLAPAVPDREIEAREIKLNEEHSTDIQERNLPVPGSSGVVPHRQRAGQPEGEKVQVGKLLPAQLQPTFAKFKN